MITEDYVSFETAKLLKEKGFDIPLLTFYITDKEKKEGDLQTMAFTDDKIDNSYSDLCYLAPTHQRAMKWLRKVHNISIEPFVDFGSGDEHWWTADVAYIKKDGLIDELCGYNSYEEAAEAALKYTLENLI